MEIMNFLEDEVINATISDEVTIFSDDYFNLVKLKADELSKIILSDGIISLINNIPFIDKIPFLGEKIEEKTYKYNESNLIQLQIQLILRDVHNLANSIRKARREEKNLPLISVDELGRLIESIPMNKNLANSPEIRYLQRDLSEIVEYPEEELRTLHNMIIVAGIDNINTPYTLCSFNESKSKMYGYDGEYNLKFKSRNGYFEVVYKIDGSIASLSSNAIYDRANAGMVIFREVNTEDVKEKWGNYVDEDVFNWILNGDIPSTYGLDNNQLVITEGLTRYTNVYEEIVNREIGNPNTKEFSEQQYYFFNFEPSEKVVKLCERTNYLPCMLGFSDYVVKQKMATAISPNIITANNLNALGEEDLIVVTEYWNRREFSFPDTIEGIGGIEELNPNDRWHSITMSNRPIFDEEHDNRINIIVAPKLLNPDYLDTDNIGAEDFEVGTFIDVVLVNSTSGDEITMPCIYNFDGKAHSFNYYSEVATQAFINKNNDYNLYVDENNHIDQSFIVESGYVQTGIAYPNSANGLGLIATDLAFEPDHADSSVIEFPRPLPTNILQPVVDNFNPNDYDLVKVVVYFPQPQNN